MSVQTTLRILEMPAELTVPRITFHFTVPCTLKSRKTLKAFLLKLFKAEKKSLASLSYIFCSDDYLLKINQTYLRHDFFTDIITFDLSSSRSRLDGEIYISVDRVKDNARTHSVSFQEELHRVIFHGALHLCGYKDKSKSEAAAMRAAENKLLKAYFG